MGLFGDAVNAVGDGLESGYHKVKKAAGSAIEHGAHVLGDSLDHVGLNDLADWVEDEGDHVADHLGAHVPEQQLGQSEEPDELLHGDPAKVRAVILHLAKFSAAFDSGHTGLSHLDPGDWDGFGAEAYRRMFTAQPTKWAHAAAACTEAGLALDSYVETLDWARGQAKEAVRLWKQGVAATKAAMASYNAAVDRYHRDVQAYNNKIDDGKDPGPTPVKPRAFVDPGAADRKAAKETLHAARSQRDSAAVAAEPKIRAATGLAPAKPEFTDRMENDFGDVGKALPIMGEHFAGGLIRSVTDLERFARGLNPYDPYNLTHPFDYLTHLNATAAGLTDMAAHPERLPGILLGTGWGSDGPEAGGRLIGNILLALATDGSSAAGKTAAENAVKDAGEQAAKDGAESASRLSRGVKRRPRNGPPVSMTMDSVRAVAERYSVDLKGIKIEIKKSVSGLCGSTPSATHINLYRDAFYDNEQLAKTLAHERFHVDQIKRGARLPADEAEVDAWEREAYAYENEWWENHPENRSDDGG